MTAETSSARGEWVLVPREPSAGMLDSAENAMIESEWAYNAGEPDARSDAHGFPTMRIWQAVVAYRAMLAAAPPPAAARGDVRGLVDKLVDAAYQDGMQELDAMSNETLSARSALEQALAAEDVQAGEVASWQRSIELRPGHWGEWAEYTDIYGEGRPEKVGRFNCRYRPLYTASALSQQPKPKAEAQGVVDEGSRSVTRQLLHWNGVPVHVTGTVTTSPGNWSLIDAALTGERNG